MAVPNSTAPISRRSWPATNARRKRGRPAQARFGSLVERVFGTTNTQFLYNLLGNTQMTRNVRQVTKSVNPKELAVWPLKPLLERLWEYLYEIYEKNVNPAHG